MATVRNSDHEGSSASDQCSNGPCIETCGECCEAEATEVVKFYNFVSYIYPSSRIAFFLNRETQEPESDPTIHWIRRVIGLEWSKGFIGILLTEPAKKIEEGEPTP